MKPRRSCEVVGLQQNLFKKPSLNKEGESADAGEKRKNNKTFDADSPRNNFK